MPLMISHLVIGSWFIPVIHFSGCRRVIDFGLRLTVGFTSSGVRPGSSSPRAGPAACCAASASWRAVPRPARAGLEDVQKVLPDAGGAIENSAVSSGRKLKLIEPPDG
jgi:hypothetical protein